MRDSRPMLVQFHEKYDISDAGCWLWRGNIMAGGYGTWGINGDTVYAHRWAYTQFRGLIPDGLVLDHLCRARSCVNPDHLNAVTHRENCFAEGSQATARLNSLKTECKHGHPFTEENTRQCTQIKLGRLYEYRQCRTCERESVRAHQARKKTG